MKYIFLVSIFILIGTSIFAQEVKKSTEIEVIQGKKYYIHTVEKGQTLYSIAKAYEVSVDAIAYENPDVFNGIKPDQKLKIPVLATPYKTKEHTVQKGETLYGIAKKYSATVEEIVQLNPEVSKGINPGQVIQVPVRDIASAEYKTEKPAEKKQPSVQQEISVSHEVVKGETVYGITKKYNISIEQFYEWNPGVKQNGLKVGDVVIVSKKQSTEKKQESTIAVKKQEEEQKLPEPKGFEAATKNKTENLHSINCSEVKSPFQTVNVSLLIPLHNDLAVIDDELSSTDPNFKLSSKPYLEFYEGFLMAVDSLRKTGLSVNLYQYEVKKDVEKVMQLFANTDFQQSDIIIGPFHDEVLEPVASWAEKRQIPVINPVIPNSKTLFNYSNVIQLNTTLNTQLKQVTRYTAMFDTVHLVIVHANTEEEKAMINLYKKQYLQDFSNNFPNKLPVIKEVSYNTVGLEGLEKALSKNNINIIFIPSQSQVFVINMMTKLNELTKTYKLILSFMPSWKKFENNFELEHLFNLHTHAFMPFYIDYSKPEVIYFVKNYRFYYKTDPSRLSFIGYDAGVYFLTLLQKYGRDFLNCINSNSVQTMSSAFYFEKVSSKGGFENNGVFIVRYDDVDNSLKLTNIIADTIRMPLYLQPIQPRKVVKY